MLGDTVTADDIARWESTPPKVRAAGHYALGIRMCRDLLKTLLYAVRNGAAETKKIADALRPPPPTPTVQWLLEAYALNPPKDPPKARNLACG